MEEVQSSLTLANQLEEKGQTKVTQTSSKKILFCKKVFCSTFVYLLLFP